MPNAKMIKSTDFTGLHAAFLKSLKDAFEKNDVQILRKSYDSYSNNSDHDKKSPMDQAFREILMFKLSSDVDMIGKLVKLSVEAVRAEIVSVTIPVVLLGDIFETVTLDKCEKIFNYVEEMVEVWKEEIFFSSCKNNILRMCNDLLRRLSRAQNTVFCGRILLFLSKFFPFSERSGLNIVSEFNLENVTDYGVDGKDLDDTLEDIEDIPIKIDYNLYCKFWSLQDFFRNPNQCYSKASWKMFQIHATTVLESFSSFKLEDLRSASAQLEDNNDDMNDKMDVDINYTMDLKNEIDQSVQKVDHFFAKFLTNPKLLALQLSDGNFRRAVLVQFLILFQYLQLTVKFKAESNTLTQAQSDFIKETEAKVYLLLEETPPNGKRYSRTVKHMLQREEMWNNWKNDGCKEFKKPEEITSDDKPPPAKRERKTLGESLKEANRQGKFFLGNEVLTRLWNYCPDNLQACKSEERNFLPQVETYLESSRDKNDTSFEWRALRLLARQSPHFFTFINSPSYKTSDYLDAVRKRLTKERLDAAKQAAAISNGTSTVVSSGEIQETLQEQETEPEGNDEGVLEGEEETTDLDKAEEDNNTHSKPLTATREQIEELAPLIGDDWKKLGKKLGYAADELLYFEESAERDGGCVSMLVNWFADDDDASLDNLAYTMEGLEINTAAKAVKAIIERSAKYAQRDVDEEEKVETL
uniref:Death domain-containing protein n=1 Tax=Stomoxys calcitrans TaxID=35570 RepID=A0A1I8PR36_STOCA